MEQKMALALENSEMKPKVEVYDTVVATRHMKLHQFARTLPKCNSKIKSDLLDLGYLHHAWGTYKVRSQYRDNLFPKSRDSYSKIALERRSDAG